MLSALSARLLVDDTQAYILTNFKGVTLFQPWETNNKKQNKQTNEQTNIAWIRCVILAETIQHPNKQTLQIYNVNPQRNLNISASKYYIGRFSL